METLRTPLFIIALVLIALAVLLEIGSPMVARIVSGAEVAESALSKAGADFQNLPQLKGVSGSEIQNEISAEGGKKPPGMGIPYMSLLDSLVLFTVGLMGAGLLLSERFTGRVQGIVTLVVSIICLFAGIKMIFIAIGKLILMVTLLMAIPFGTLIYLCRYAFFDRGGASAMLSLIMTLKLGFLGCLLFAQQRFLSMKGLMLIILTSLLAVLIITFLHGLVPGILVSITDAIAAIVVAILAVFWALFLLLGSLVSIVKAIKLKG